MKKNLLILFSVLSVQVYGQQFSFQMYFSDAIGNKDTITLGYDVTATDSIDPAFGEVNIISVPLNTSFDVRITNEWYHRYSTGMPGTFHTKKQINAYDCNPLTISNDIQSIDIYSTHWPVTVTWDNSLFNDSCRNGSVFTSINPGGWWDTGSPSDLWRQELRTNGSVTFTSNAGGGLIDNYCYVNNIGDTVSVFWHLFGDSTILFNSVNDIDPDGARINVFPNPSSESVSISASKPMGELKQIEFYNAFGQVVLFSRQLKNIDISSLPAGLYIIKLTNKKGFSVMTKLQRV